MISKISPFLWFDGQAQAAAELYCSVFPDSRITRIVNYPEGSPGEAGTVMTVEFELFGQPFVALNGGPEFQFNFAVSFVVHCDTQEEVDRYWDALRADGKVSQCGWVADPYGLPWQICRRQLDEMLAGDDPAATQRAFSAMMTMDKLDLPTLERAYRGE